MFILGITGPSGAGKSMVSKRLSESGFADINADFAAREVVKKGKPCLTELADAFGGDIIKSDGTLDRPLLAKRAFSGGKVELLNKITHPFIIEEMKNGIKKAESDGKTCCVLDAPALFESGLDKLCNKIVCVTAPPEMRLERICARDNITKEKALERMNAQHGDDYYKKGSDYFICNNGDVKLLTESVDRIVANILNNNNHSE